MRRTWALAVVSLTGICAIASGQPAFDTIQDKQNPNIQYGVAGPRGRVLDKTYFVVNYRDSCRIPYWSAYLIVAESLYGKQARLDRFDTDDQIPPEFQSRHDDYTNTGFDRGHLAPAALYQRNEEAYASTYVCSNICPEHRRFNQGKWQTLESQIRTMVKNKGRAWVVTGTAFIGTDSTLLGEDDYDWIPVDGPPRVAVPTHVYDAILAEDAQGGFITYAFLMPNKRNWTKREAPRQFVVSVDRLEEMLGMDFFPGLPDEIESECEAVKARWDWKGSWK